MQNSIRDNIVAFISGAGGVPAERIKPESTFSELALDSLAFIELALLLRKDLKIDVRDEDLERMKTIGQLMELVENQQPR